MSFTKLRDGRSVYALDSLRLRTRKQANTAPQAGTVELYIKDGILYQVDEQGVSKEAAVTPATGRFYLPANQLVAPNVLAVLGLSTPTFQSEQLVYGTGTSTRFKVTLPGKYRISAKITVQPAGSLWNNADPALILSVNGTNTAILQQAHNLTGGMGLSLAGSTIVDLKFNDYVELKFFRSAGTGSATVYGNEAHTYLDIDRVGF